VARNAECETQYPWSESRWGAGTRGLGMYSRCEDMEDAGMLI
jgi:hypothetical protein